MDQVVQNIRDGKLRVTAVPEPMVRPGHLLIQNECSVISAGTEKFVIDMASKSLLQKARSRPDLVQQIWRKLKTQGVRQTVQQVTSKLDEPIALGYHPAVLFWHVAKGFRAFGRATESPRTEIMQVLFACRNICVR